MACSLIRQVNSEQTVVDGWTFGGGSAMMLQIDHRDSHDVDIFLPDPQLISFLDPQRRDFQFEIQPYAYGGDGARSLRFAFRGLGQIDFIVAHALTASPTTRASIEGEDVLLETIPEIVTKKVYYRGFALKPRDIFDIAAAGERGEVPLVEELRKYPNEVAKALATLERLDAEFVDRTIAQLAIKDQYKAIAKGALQRSKEILCAV
jgi:Nucleotidyl transferase AbiEii toxin, Type IV TA system